LWLRGHAGVREFMLTTGAGCRGSRLIPVDACGAPAFAHYKPGEGNQLVAWSLNVVDVEDGQISHMYYFLDVQRLFPRFQLPLAIDK
jgi:RNA polymerase sigma-70 factor, ECF subfamily